MPQRWRLISQLSTLFVTAALGVSIAVTPPKVDSKLSVIEQAMNAASWAWTMFIFGFIGLAVESIVAKKKTMHSIPLIIVSICHIICMSVLLGYSLSAAVSLVRTGHWYAFGGPILGLYLSLMHYVFVKRRYAEPADVIKQISHG